MRSTAAQLDTILHPADRLREAAREREMVPLPAECGAEPADWERRLEVARGLVRRAIEQEVGMKHDADGWWFQNPYDKPEWFGPYDTKKEANEARVSFKRNYIGLFRPEQVCTK